MLGAEKLRVVAKVGALFALLAVLCTSPVAGAADSLYTVAKISVDTSAKDAVAAKAAGMAEAQARGFGILLKRLFPESAYAGLPEVPQEDVEALVDGVSVRDEQMSTTRYIATLDVSFNEQAVKQLLASYNLQFSETRAPLVSVMPLVLDGNAVNSEGPEGWRQAWLALDLSNGIVPVNVVQPRPELTGQTVKAILGGDEAAFSQMQSEYGDAPLVLAVGQVEGGKFVTRLAGKDDVGKIDFGRSDPVGQDGAKKVARDAALVAFGIIENRWKTTQSGGAAPQGQAAVPGGTEAGVPQAEKPQGEVARQVDARVEFSGLKAWQEMRAKLVNVPGIQALEVNSLSARGAQISFEYAGSLGKLQKELEQDGFSFENSEESFILRSR
jgi:hypothetical protein